MIGPGGLAQPNGGCGPGAGDEVTQYAQGAAAAGGLDRRHASGRKRRVAGPEQQLLHGLVEPRIARDGDVALGFLGFDDAAFGALDALQYGRAPRLVLKHPRAQVNLRRGWVGAKHGHDAENGVGGFEFQIFEHGRSWCCEGLGLAARGKSPASIGAQRGCCVLGGCSPTVADPAPTGLCAPRCSCGEPPRDGRIVNDWRCGGKVRSSSRQAPSTLAADTKILQSRATLMPATAVFTARLAGCGLHLAAPATRHMGFRYPEPYGLRAGDRRTPRMALGWRRTHCCRRTANGQGCSGTNGSRSMATGAARVWSGVDGA